MRAANGFSLIELLIVVAIILVIAAIAIPSLLQARMSANEASAVNSVRQIRTAEVAYSTVFPAVGYAAMLAHLGGALPCSPQITAACLLDNSLATAGVEPGKSGYVFSALGIASGAPVNSTLVIGSAPLAYRQTGRSLFCTTDDGVLRSDPSAGVPVTTVAGCLAYPGVVH